MPNAGIAERSEVISTLGECLPKILWEFEYTKVTLLKIFCFLENTYGKLRGVGEKKTKKLAKLFSFSRFSRNNSQKINNDYNRIYQVIKHWSNVQEHFILGYTDKINKVYKALCFPLNSFCSINEAFGILQKLQLQLHPVRSDFDTFYSSSALV